MYLSDLELHSAPGLPSGLKLEDAAPGLNLVVGPNASGKSTLARTLRGALLGGPPPHVNATLQYRDADGSSTWQVQAAHGVAQWLPAPPKLPATSAERYALSLSLLLQATGSDAQLAQSLSVELAGGYDVDAALNQISRGLARQPTRIKEARTAQERINARRQLEGQAEALAAEEGRLQKLHDEIEASAQGRTAHRAAQWLIELAEARHRLQELRAQFDPFPANMDRVWPEALQELVALQGKSSEVTRKEEAAAQAARDAEAAVSAVAFSTPTPTREQLREALSLIHDWREATQSTQAAEADRAEARARCDDALSALVHRPGDATIGPDALDALESALDALRAHKATHARAQDDLAAHPKPQGSATPGLDEAVHELRKWLRTPPATQAANPAASLRLPALGVAAVGFVLLLLGGGLMVAGFGGLAGVILLFAGLLLGAGLAATALSAAGGPSSRDPRADIEAALQSSPHKPSGWTDRAVAARLDELEQARQREHADARRLEDHDTARRRAAQAAQALHEAEAAFQRAVQQAGLSGHFAGLSAVQQAQHLSRYVSARQAAAEATGRWDAARERRDAARSRLDAWLADIGLPPATAPAAAQERIQSMEDQLARLHKAEAALHACQRDLDAARQEVRAFEGEVATFWERVGLEPGYAQELRHRVQNLGTYRTLKRSIEATERDIAGLEQRVAAEAEALAKVGVTTPTRVSLDDARQLVATLEEAAQRHEDLVNQRAQILARIEAAQRGSTLSDAVNAEQEAIAVLDARRHDHLVDDLAIKLLQQAQQAHGRDAAPPVLQRARDTFLSFTHHHYRLEIARDGDGSAVFMATHTPTGARRSLGELSDATRIQLLLALRLAAIEADEGASGPLPLCLDEVLSTTDPKRFQEVCTALLQLTDAGRQVFYFTADPAEVHWWRQLCDALDRPAPKVHDLGRAMTSSLRLPELPASPTVPEPEPGQSANSYLTALGVQPPSGHTPASWHLGLLLDDDLPSVHALLLARIDRVGPWREVVHSGGAVPVSDEVRQTLQQRVELLEATLEAWRVGRGTPVDWATVEASGAITRTFEDRTREVFDAHRHEPRRFLDEVCALQRFRSSNAEALEAALYEAGHLRDEPPLSADAILRRALASTGADPSEAGPHIRRWLALIDAME